MLLEKLSNAHGPSGFEGEVRNIIKEQIKEFKGDISIDRMGNIIVHKKGNGKKVLVEAHMDEVGFIITGYNEDGTLKFTSLGNINAKVPPAKPVLIGEHRVNGVIGLKPIHLQSKKERQEALHYDDYCIDIGADSKEQAKKYVDLGDYALFTTQFDLFGDGLIKGKAFDDRMGCYLLVEALKEEYDCDLYGVFNVQEETGERGAYVSSYKINPDIGIALEGTVCADIPNIPEHLKATKLGEGPAISIMDKSSLFTTTIKEDIAKIGLDNNIQFQYRKAVAGGNDAGAIHMSSYGSKVATISIPCRYIHSSVSVASLEDIENGKKLLVKYLKTL
ncbi:MAG: M42 family metallopeptidase [Clostridiaceae bacterium]